jgi:hypothetical protein
VRSEQSNAWVACFSLCDCVRGSYLKDEGLANLAGGVVGGVLVPGESARLHYGSDDGVPEHHLDGGGGDGREAEGAYLPLQRQVHVEVAGGGERAVGPRRRRGERDEVGALGARAGREREQLVGGAGLGEQHEHVPGEERADVAVERVDGGQEAGPREAQRRQRLRDLPRHDAGLADAREEDGPGRVEQRLRERRRLRHVEAVEEVVQVPALRGEERRQVRRRHRGAPLRGEFRRGVNREGAHGRRRRRGARARAGCSRKCRGERCGLVRSLGSGETGAANVGGRMGGGRGGVCACERAIETV